MTVMTARAPKVPAKTALLGCLKASRSAMKKVLSPISEKNIKRKPETNPSVKGLSPTIPAGTSGAVFSWKRKDVCMHDNIDIVLVVVVHDSNTWYGQ